MDAATKPPWTGLRRPPQPDPPRHPTECPLLPLTLPLLRPLQVQGGSPANQNTPTARNARSGRNRAD
ncbi:hypothetical protein B9Y75_12650 [Stenotrophomonas maltophilia]|nr:hypothetical protein B9Y75_12650 [Stenotrophomonas maltophilia]